MKKKALFRLDSGGKFGLGHVMRSKALADALLKIGIDSTFAVRIVHSDDAVNPHKVIIIHSEDDFLSLAKAYDVIIIDHYDYTTELFLKLSKLEQTRLVILDDECNRGNLYADLIINSVNQAKSLPYQSVAPKAQLLLGSDYILLNQAFTQMQCLDYEKRDLIVITFGGSDVTGMTLPVLIAIKNTSLIHFKIIVITGAGCQNNEQIKTYCHQHSFVHYHNVKNMAEIFSKAKFAISAAGSTTFELAYCGVPAVFAVVADNQLLSITEQSQHGWCEMVDCRRQNKVEELVQKAEQMIHSPQLKTLSQKVQLLVDGQGAERIASEIKNNDHFYIERNV